MAEDSSSSSKRPQLDEHAQDTAPEVPAASSAPTSAPGLSTEADASKKPAVPADAISVVASTSSGSTGGHSGGGAGFDFVFQAGDDTWSIVSSG